MKPISKKILACAVGAGLLTFATSRAQAVVVDDEVLTPLTFTLTAFTTPNEDNGKIVKVRVTNKDILAELSDVFDENLKHDDISYEVGFDDSGDVLLTHNNTVDEDLSDGDYLTIDLDTIVSSETENGNHEKYSESGEISLDFYSDPQFDYDDETGEYDIFDQGLSEDESDVWVELSGDYHYTESDTITHNDKVQVATTFKSSLNGEGFDDNFSDDEDTVPVSGTMTGTGSGTVEEP